MDNNKNKKTLSEITRECMNKHGDILNSRMCIIDAEFRQGFELMKNYPRSVTIFGSARLKPETDIYQRVLRLSKKIADMDYTVVTGGGHGIMGAANEGANASNSGHSLGINIKLPFEQTTNPHLDESIEFHHFFSRKVILAYAAEAYIYCPGGFGTLDEMFEILTLKQTGKIPNIPIVLYGSEFWNPLEEYFKSVMLLEGQKTINPEDLNLYTITDDDDEILEIVKNAPVRNDISNLQHLGQGK
jgi:hypothetical protein